MKIRLGHVSNSSSSSFVVAGKEDAKVVFQVSVKLSELGKPIRSIEQYEEHVIDLSWYDDIDDYFEKNGDWARERYDQVKRALDAGMTVYVGHVSNTDYDEASLMIYNEGFPEPGEYVVIQNTR